APPALLARRRGPFFSSSLTATPRRCPVPSRPVPSGAVSDASYGGGATVRFYFDFASPWSFLGWTQLGRQLAALEANSGRRVTIEYFPILLGALFKESV